MRNNPPLRGNALFFVLIAVALFAALSFAVTKNWRTTFTQSSQEQARLNADEIIQYGNSFRVIIDQMLLMNGVLDNNATAGTGILFSATGANAAYGAYGTYPTVELFNPVGGKITYQSPSSGTCNSACAYEFSGQYTVPGVGSDAKSELAMLVIDVTQTVCQKANDLLNLGWSTIPTDAALTLTRFNGATTQTYTDLGGSNAIPLGGTFAGLRAFCYRESSGSQRYIYLHVIRAR